MGVPVRPEDLRLRFIVEEDAPLVSLGHPFQALVELLQVLDALGELGTLLTQGSADLRCRVIENLTHRVQPETSLPVRDDSMQPLQVRVGVLAIAAWWCARTATPSRSRPNDEACGRSLPPAQRPRPP